MWKTVEFKIEHEDELEFLKIDYLIIDNQFIILTNLNVNLRKLVLIKLENDLECIN